MRHDRFNYRGTFRCAICERMTRDTGQGVDHLCEPCFEICGMDNAINDGRFDDDGSDNSGYEKECNRLLKLIEKKGGNVAKVKKQNCFVWPTEKAK
jgi:hypothetical protein